MKTILVSGGEGRFAKALIKVNKKYKIYAPSKKTMDILRQSSIEKYIKNKKIDYFIHAAIEVFKSKNTFQIQCQNTKKK